MKADKYIKPEIEIIEMESEVIATSPTDLGNKKPANPGSRLFKTSSRILGR